MTRTFMIQCLGVNTLTVNKELPIDASSGARPLLHGDVVTIGRATQVVVRLPESQNERTERLLAILIASDIYEDDEHTANAVSGPSHPTSSTNPFDFDLTATAATPSSETVFDLRSIDPFDPPTGAATIDPSPDPFEVQSAPAAVSMSDQAKIIKGILNRRWSTTEDGSGAVEYKVRYKGGLHFDEWVGEDDLDEAHVLKFEAKKQKQRATAKVPAMAAKWHRQATPALSPVCESVSESASEG